MEEFLFEFKKTASIYLNPVTISLELVILGMVLIGFSRRKPKKKPTPRWKKFKRIYGDFGIFLIVMGCLFLYLCCISPVSDSLLYTLEKQNPPLQSNHPEFVKRFGDPPDHIVVLAGGSRYHERKQPSSQLKPPTTARVIEASILHRHFPGASFIVTGRPEETNGMAAMAVALGVPGERIIQESESRDSKDHPVKLETLIRTSDRFLLVTSALHMPRALAIFEGHGYEPVPAACDFWVYPKFAAGNPYQSHNFVPLVENLYKTDLAFHELLGIAWAKMRRQTGEPEEASETGKSPEVEPHSSTIEL